jgi:hypothetical protein
VGRGQSVDAAVPQRAHGPGVMRWACLLPGKVTHADHAVVAAVHGFALEAGSWRGEDIFRPRRLYGSLVVSGRFERSVVKHGFTNMRMIPSEDYVWNIFGRDPASPMKPALFEKDIFSGDY